MTEQNAAPKATRARARAQVNESTDGHLSGTEMRAALVRDPAVTLEVVNEWRAYLEATPIAAETFLPESFCAALNALAAEVDKP